MLDAAKGWYSESLSFRPMRKAIFMESLGAEAFYYAPVKLGGDRAMVVANVLKKCPN